MEYFLYFMVGVVAGGFSGLMGIGGGLIVVPALYLIFEQQGFNQDIIIKLAAGSCLAGMIATTAVSLRAHVKRGADVWPMFSRLAPGILVGIVIGGVLVRFLSGHLINQIFAVFVAIIAIRMFFPTELGQAHQLPNKWVIALVGVGIGTFSGLLGLGGGILTIPFLTHCRFEIRHILGVSLACGLMIALFGTLSFMIAGDHVPNLPNQSIGYVYWPAALGIALGSPILTSPAADLTTRLPARVLQLMFGCLLLVIALKMFLT